MSEVNIRDTHGAIFGMDQMCTGTIPDDLRRTDLLLFVRHNGETARLEIGVLRAHRNEEGEIGDVVGIGLRGEFANEVSPGDVLMVEPTS